MRIEGMTSEQALEINTWTYEKPYDLYNFSGKEEDINELLDGSYFSCLNDQNELIGYFCFGKSAQVPGGWKTQAYHGEGSLDIGLGMNPFLVGRGFGQEFLLNGLNYGMNRFNPKKFRLSVATFNKRAITLYKNLGFKEGQTFCNNDIEYMIMEANEFRGLSK